MKNRERRPREYLTPKEVAALMKAATKRKSRGPNAQRDATMILIAYRHGLRVGELCSLRWDQVDFDQGLIHIRRLKNGVPSVHPVRGTELRSLRKLQRGGKPSPYVFTSERGTPMSPAGFRKTLARIGEEADLGFPVHPHMLRHACGYKLANDGQDTRAIQHYMGHKNIQHTVTYTDLDPKRFNTFFDD